MALARNFLPSESVCLIAEAIAENSSLQKLDLDSNDITVEACTTIGMSLAVNSSLKSLSLAVSLSVLIMIYVLKCE